MQDKMLSMAKDAMEKAYAPYSNFLVGAVIHGKSGGLYSGCNVENAAYPQSCCAEASAISAMVLAGEREIAEILVMGKGDDIITPCGGCRQKIREFASDDTAIFLAGPQGIRKSVTLGDLLPLSFGPEYLK